MPAEAVHLSALEDTFADAALAPAWADLELRRCHRLGAVLLDLAYFDGFTRSVVRYVLRRPVATSPLGDALHKLDPSRVSAALLKEAAVLRARPSSRREGDRLLAVALGFVSHLAVDSRLHPLVNALAGARATRIGDHAARQHSEVEKFHSILFHEARLGFDFMGSDRIAAYIAIDEDALGGLIGDAYGRAIASVHGGAPTRATMLRWVRGYGRYARLLASFVGGRIMPRATKDEVRAEVYDDAGFVAHYGEAVARSRAYVEAALGLAAGADEASYHRVVLPGSIDDPPGATDRERGAGVPGRFRFP